MWQCRDSVHFFSLSVFCTQFIGINFIRYSCCGVSKSGLTLHDFELTTTCDGPPRRRRRQDVVLCETLCDFVGCDSNNQRVSQAVVSF